jgi:hypothetical protein
VTGFRAHLLWYDVNRVFQGDDKRCACDTGTIRAGIRAAQFALMLKYRRAREAAIARMRLAQLKGNDVSVANCPGKL